MTSLFSIHHWHSMKPEEIPKDTHTLHVHDIPSDMKFHWLLAAVPQLTRLTIRGSYRGYDWEKVGKALLQTPHVNYLDCSLCNLEDGGLLNILEGCTLNLCELRLSSNSYLKFKDEALIRRLGYFTNLQ